MKYSLLTKQCFFKLSWISLSLKKKIKTNLHSLLMNKEQQRKTPKQRENKIVGSDRYILILYTTWWIFLSYSKKWKKNIFTPLLLQCFEGVHHLFLFYYSKGRTLDSLSQAKERKTQFSITFFLCLLPLQIWKWYRQMLQAWNIKQLYKPLIWNSSFRCSKALVLIKNRWQAPFLQFSIASN